jgi:tetratricopeptide (TPR) repeat protein
MMRAVAAGWAWKRGVAALAATMLALALPNSSARAQSLPIKGTVALSQQSGFARVIVKLDEDVETDVTTTGNIMLMRFKRPVALAFESLDTAAPDYVGAVRRDPDNLAIRFALQRKLVVNTMSAGERTFVDLLPDDWKGPPPGLPVDVVRDLAERARAAERILRQQRTTATPPKERATVRVRASQQPTFMRYVFELPEGVTGQAGLNARRLTVSFDTPLNFDLADARIVSPPSIGAMSQRVDTKGSAVEMVLVGDAELRAFREDNAYIVDLVSSASDALNNVEKIAAQSSPVAKRADEVRVPAGDVAAAASKAVAAAIKGNPPATKAAVSVPVAEPAPQPLQIMAPPRASPESKPAAMSPPPVPANPSPMPAPAMLDDEASGATRVEAKRSSDSLRVLVPLPESVPAALFRRADSFWFVLDWDKPIDLSAIKREGGALISDTLAVKLDKGQAIRIRLNRPQLASLIAAETEGREAGWTLTFSDVAQTLPRPLDAMRNISDPARASVVIALPGAGRQFKLVDPDAGDALLIVTAKAPSRGVMRRQDFVEFTLLETVQGVAIQAHADDLQVDATPERVTLARPGGLTLSAALEGVSRAVSPVKSLFDLHEWQENQRGPFRVRLDALTDALSRAPDSARSAARGDIVRFYFARGFYPEAKAMLDSMLQAEKSEPDDPVALVLHAVASILMGRPELALKDINNPALGSNFDSQLWKAMAFAQQGKWSDAREKFKNSGFAINALPFELQRVALMQAITAAIEINDFADAASRMSELELVGIPDNLKPSAMVLRGKIAQALARDNDALADFRSAAQSSNRQAATEGRLLEIALKLKREEIPEPEALRDLETLSMTWRGDSVEIKALQMLVKLYRKTGRYADALAAARTATRLQANSEVSRQLQDEAAELFSQMYLTSKGDDIPPIEALATFYENRDLTPIGRRGDELIRRLSERLVAVDLLDQASELLQYQVDHRLEGAARAQVAARLATIYLMNRKPERAITALRSTRIADLAGELRQQRLLLEARAQSDIGRRDLALDIISNVGGREAIRLRSDIHWAARRWREASEQIELYLGERYRDFKPLETSEKSDVVRAIIGYALAEDSLGLARFREKFAPLMNGVADRAAFDIAAKPATASSAEFAQIAKLAASVDTLEGFIREMKSRFPDTVARTKQTPQSESTGTLPKIGATQRAER